MGGFDFTIGSPPRMWGSLTLIRAVLGDKRFTPTYVGKPQVAGHVADVLSVHPHVCGEANSQRRSISSACGSPPRMWGILTLGLTAVHPHILLT